MASQLERIHTAFVAAKTIIRETDVAAIFAEETTRILAVMGCERSLDGEGRAGDGG